MKNLRNKLSKHLLKKAKKVIPGRNILFSKRPDVLLSESWLTYFNKAKDSYVCDLNNNKFINYRKRIYDLSRNHLKTNNKSINFPNYTSVKPSYQPFLI